MRDDKRLVLFLASALLCAPAARSGPAPAIPSEIFPQPVNASFGSTPLPICAGFAFVCAGACPAPLPAALARYAALTFFAGAPAAAAGACLPSLRVVLSGAPGGAALAWGVDESYALAVPADGSAALLTAATQWGALRGLESALQLIVWAGPDAAPGAYAVTAAPVRVWDAPRFAARGVLIDTSFNFLTVAAIKDVLDSMAVMKANILHWHALDDPAWPLVIEAAPAFTARGGGGPYAQVATYSVAEQADIAAYAWARGIMILLEFDLPGHSASWAAGGADLVIACDGHPTLINPAGELGSGIYAMLAGLIAELHGRIGSPGLPWVHLGGDEVTDYSCWDTSPTVQAWAQSLNISGDAASVRTAFTQRVQAVAAAAGLRALFWEEAFNGGFGVRNDSIVSPWVRTDVAGAATALGHDVLNYAGYYLDQWVPPARTDVEWSLANVSYGFIDSFRVMYAYDPERGVAPGSPGRVLGGVACAWGDNTDTSLGAVGLLYPRGLAVGEKLWSAAAATRIVDVQADDAILDAVAARMEHARCRLVQRGIGAAPVGIAGTFGFCWTPAWAPPPPPPPPAPTPISSGALAAALSATAIGGAVLAALALPALRGSAGAWLVGGGAGGGGGAGDAAASSGAGGGGAGGSAGDERVVALDQFRGMTMVTMLFVNLYYGRTGLWPIFSHGITYFSGPDLVEPAFHFCVGFALRLVVLKRLAKLARGGGSRGWWADRLAIFRPLLANRVCGLIILSLFFTDGWGQWDSWADVGSFGDWLLALVRNRQPYHTLLHIAFITVYTFLAMTLSWRARLAQLAATAVLHALLHATFYFRWIAVYTLDEGGYFGFMGWAIEALAGSLAHDVLMHCRHAAGTSSGARRQPLPATAAGDKGAAAQPLLAPSDGGSDQDDAGEEPVHAAVAAALDGAAAAAGKGAARSSHGALNAAGGGDRGAAAAAADASAAAARRAAAVIAIAAVAAMLLAYLLSCLGTAGPGALNPACYDGTRIFFWGGFGAEVPCTGVPAAAGWLVRPPFALPDPASNVVTMWTLTQRAGSVTYHIFGAATSGLFFALLLLACEVGVRAPGWWAPVAAPARGVLGVHAAGGRLLLRWHVPEVFGENALAVYLLSDPLGDHIGDMLPPDCPNWYFLLWGEGLYLAITYIAAAYLRAHKLFLRL